MNSSGWLSTGLGGLDEVLSNLKKGDNVVWQVDDIEHYKYFVLPYVNNALQTGTDVIYLRFARHEPLFKQGGGITRYDVDPDAGFESFSTQIHNIITKHGRDVCYVFDCLSDLLSAWATDLMIGNFFMITCPYLYELDTLAYFAILRNNHSFKTIARIRETTQLLLDVYSFEDSYYVHPLKVWQRYTPTMFLPHKQVSDKFVPVGSSVETAKLLSYMSNSGFETARRSVDYWDRLFLSDEQLLKRSLDPLEERKIVSQLCRIMIGRDPRMLSLAQQNFSVQDLLNIKARLIGTGYVGGKAVGMLLSRKILAKDASFGWSEILEPHDSFYIGSDVFYSYIVQNNWWKLRLRQKTKEEYFSAAEELKEKMLHGTFPDEIRGLFQELIEYFGQSPIIVRSSSLLEDAFGNAFAGKYESIFLVNQGTPEQRYKAFENAVRTVYASSMNEDALTYRLSRGLDQQDEQMSLLVQRVSGSYRNHYFFPDMAGVGVSYNTFVWNQQLDPKAGMLRIVLGLGTRAVERVEDDYPRIVAIDSPLLKPHDNMADIKQFSQHSVDLLNITENRLETIAVSKLVEETSALKMNLIGTRDLDIARRLSEAGKSDAESWIVTFDRLFSDMPLGDIMQRMLKTLERVYDYPVDIEFTVNFSDDEQFHINLLQCRPLQTKGSEKKVKVPANVSGENILFKSRGSFMGGSISQPITRIIFVYPQEYIDLPQNEKYNIARTIGKLNRQIADKTEQPTMLVGPGRWGTTTPSLGVPVSFAEINNVSVLVELSYPGGNLMPELSYGTHFFQDLVETDIFYVAVFTQKEGVVFNLRLLDKLPNKLAELLPDAKQYENIVKVCDTSAVKLKIIGDLVSQEIICFK